MPVPLPGPDKPLSLVSVLREILVRFEIALLALEHRRRGNANNQRDGQSHVRVEIAGPFRDSAQRWQRCE